MATSESEDFESADEDFEFDNSKEKHLPKKGVTCDTKLIDNSIKNIHIKEGHSRDGVPCEHLEKDVADKNNELTDLKENTDSERTNENNSGTEVPVKLETRVTLSSKSKRPQQVRIKSDTSSGPKKLGTRVSITNKVDENVSETYPTKSDEQSESETHKKSMGNIESNKSDGDFNLLKQESTHSHISTIQQGTGSPKETGDGWEVEEEDGFEIPSLLHEKHKRLVDMSPTKDVCGALDRISSTEKTENKVNFSVVLILI